MVSSNSQNNNTALGHYALQYNTGNNNSALGYEAYLFNIYSYSNSTALGAQTSITASNQIRLGNASVSSIGGQVGWTTISDARFKKDISETVPGLTFIKKLRPVTYHMDMDALASFYHTPDSLRLRESETLKASILQTGFIAQEVEQAAKESGFDFSGVDKPKNSEDHYGLRYAEFVVPLVKGMQEQQVIIEEMKKQLDIQQKEIAELKSMINK
ncbi:MAG: tail fiber domain-containing protein [Bacteroidota bacterium]|nr:tail fiber domain-containing protein [Bacteroidota bacterium]